MSSDSIVLNWLNNEIKLKPKILNIIEEFSDGYLFGEILYKLKEITLDELKSLKKVALTFEEKKSNFLKIKQLLSKIYNLEIREEEFDSVINKDISKAVVILYKLKNSIYKKKIHFADIKLFANQPTPEEIQKKVKEIMDNEFYKEMMNSKDNTQENISNQNATNTNQYISNYNSQYSTPKKKNSIIDKVEQHINQVNEEINDNESEYSNNIATLNNDKDINMLLNKEPKKNKLLPPLTTIISNTNIGTALSKELLPKLNNENNKNLNDSYDNNISPKKKENFLLRNKLIISEEKVNRKKNYFNTESSYDENKDEMLQKLRENLRRKIEIRKMKDKKKQEKIKKEFDSKIYDIPEIDFFKQDKNPFYKNRPKIKLTFSNNNRYLINSSSRRLKYSNDLKQSIERKKLENRKEYYKKLFLRNSENISNNLKKLKINLDMDDKNNEIKFNKEQYFNSLSGLNYNEYNDYIIKRHVQIKKDIPLIKDIIFLIIDYTVEGYFYQKDNNSELLDLSTYINFSNLFMSNRPAREKFVDTEADIIKEVKKVEELDINSLILTDEEKYLIGDYLNYCGIYNSELIFDGEIIGGQFDIHIVNDNLPDDYELTQNDIDDMFLPDKNVDNYPYGESILEILDNKYRNTNKNNNEGKMDNNNNNNSEIKWSHIPYKLSLIGYPLSGRKTIAENLIKKYPNLKIYSCQKLLRDYYNKYKTLSEEVDISNTKYKSMKPNQIEQLKQERQKELESFEPILKLIKPYIDQINETNLDENNSNENSKYIPPKDSVLFEVLKDKIENDFQIKPEEEYKNEIIEYQTKIVNIEKQITDLKKLISENNKPNPKDELALSNLEKEKQNLKQNYIKGFILVDYPTNLNQCYLIENYITGYVSELEKPKTEKNMMIQSIESIIDFKFHPKENNTIKKSGIDFIINIPILEKNILNRFDEIKYDPIGDKIYTKTEINESKQNLDKKIIDRLVNEVPYLTKDIFDYYKQEYDENITKINLFYNNFGLNIEKNIDLNNLIDLDDIKEIKRTYQNLDIIEEDNEKNQINKNIEFISDNIIDCLYNEKDKSDKIIFYSKHPELNVNEENDRIQFDPEVEIIDSPNKKENEKDTENLRNTKRKRTKTGTKRGGNLGKIKIMNIITENSNIVINKLINLEIYYKKNIGGFIHLIEEQRNDIYTRLNLIQKKFRDFLNYKTEKKKVIDVFTKKYNDFFSVNPKFFYSPKAINEFSEDINKLSNSLWTLITLKEKECVKELESIKKVGFIENELIKFYNNIKNIFLVETEKFLEMIDSIINLYKIKKENEENKIEIFEKEFIIKGSLPIQIDENNAIKKDNEMDKDDKNLNYTNFSHISEVSNEDEMNSLQKMNNIISVIIKNIELFYVNGIILAYKQQNRTENLIKFTKESLMQSFKKPRRKRRNSLENESLSSSQLMVSMIGTKGMDSLIQEDKIRKMFQNEKNKYKYRIYYLKIFCKKYLNIIFKTTKNIYIIMLMDG